MVVFIDLYYFPEFDDIMTNVPMVVFINLYALSDVDDIKAKVPMVVYIDFMDFLTLII